jgi:hypothetical protein
MNIEVDIYINNIIKFFKTNPEELLSLVPKDKENIFYDKIKEIANLNLKNGYEVCLTRKQLIDVCLDVNSYKKNNNNILFQKTKFGDFCLN